MLTALTKTHKLIFNETYTRTASRYLVALGRLADGWNLAGDIRIGSFCRHLPHLLVGDGLRWLDAVRRRRESPGSLGALKISWQGRERFMSRNTRLGLFLFAVYSLIYFGFVLVNAFTPRLMSELRWSGLNLATLWGMLLIFLAFGLALLYGILCRSESPTGPEDSSMNPSRK